MSSEDKQIFESTRVTVMKGKPEADYDLTTPGVGEMGSELSSVSGVHRSKYVTKSGDVIREWDDEVGDQELHPYKGSEDEKIIKAKKEEKRQSLITKVIDWLRHDDAELQAKVDTMQRDSARRTVESKEIQLGEDPALLTQERLDKYNAQRKIDQEVAEWRYQKDKRQ